MPSQVGLMSALCSQKQNTTWPLPNQFEAEGGGPVPRFHQLPLSAHIPVSPSPARDGKRLCGWRAVQELRGDVAARQRERHLAVLLGLGHIEEHTRDEAS